MAVLNATGLVDNIGFGNAVDSPFDRRATITIATDPLDGLYEVIDGRIVFVSPSAESESGRSGESAARVFPIIVSFETDNPRIRPGMSAQVEVVLSSAHNVLAVALPALFMEEGETVVYVKQPEGMFDRRTVEVGISDTDVIEIKDGLEEGEELALSKPELEGAGGAESSG